jgi:glycosyltransferase involved in cell wall biosynthesis
MTHSQFFTLHAHFPYGYRPASCAPPAVSVITPYYNTGPIFLETVQSLLRQSLQQWEWIIVNDGSDDAAALRALLPLRNADARIRVIDQPNRGVSAARNAAVAAATAPLLFFLDSDDLLEPTALEKLAWTLSARPGSAFASGWSVLFGHQNLLWPRGFDTRYAFLYENMATTRSMVRRSVFEQVGGFEEQRRQGLEDYEFWLRCADSGFWGHDVREVLVFSRAKAQHEYSSYRWTFRDDPGAMAAFRREMRARYPRLFRQGLPRIASRAGLLDTHTPIPGALPFHNRLLRPPGQRRVLLLMPWVRVGGSDRFALDLVAGLSARGDRVSVCMLRDVQHTWMEELRRSSSDLFNLPAFLQPADYPRFLRYLIKSRQIGTVLISQSLLAYQLLPYLRAYCPQVAYVDYLHVEEQWRNGGLPRAGIDHDRLLELHIVSSRHLRDWMLERGADTSRVEVCSTNIDPVRWAPDPALRARVRAELGVPAHMPLILFAARLVPQKRPQLAAEALRRLHMHAVGFTALVAGDGEDRRWLRRFVARHGLGGKIRLLGAQPHSRVRELLAASDLLLLPSEQEGIALILFEALAMGVVPVAADVGGQRELVTPDCGVLVPHGPDELDQYVHMLRRLCGDGELRERMARAGRARIVEHFSAQAMLDRMQALLDQAGARPQLPVSQGAGLAAATLAIEHYQLEERLRALPPVRAALALRQSHAWNRLGRLRGLRDYVDAADRALYALRRTLAQRIRGIIGRA